MIIAIPDNLLFQPLVARAEEVAVANNGRVIRTTEEQCIHLLHANSADLALLSPYGYGKGVTQSDYRIVPTTCCILNGWTNTGAIFFGKGLETINTLTSSVPDDFITRAGQIILEEQFDIEHPLQPGKGTVAELLTTHDAVIGWRGNEDEYTGMDISEEWQLCFDTTLPIMLWVCREENSVELPLFDITEQLAAPNLQAVQQCTEQHPHGDTFAREGEILWRWNEQTEEHLTQILYLLYYHQCFPEIPAVKILGRD